MTEMLPMSIVWEKNCFFQQLKSARIEFIPKLCHVLRFLDKHIPPQLSELYYSYGKNIFAERKKKKKRIHPNNTWKKYVQNIQDIVGLENKIK